MEYRERCKKLSGFFSCSHHYQAPVRVGGGYSVYRHQNPDRTSLSWSTLKWLSEPNNTDVKVSKGSSCLLLVEVTLRDVTKL